MQTRVVPFHHGGDSALCYAAADRRTAGRESIAAKLVANLITEAGATRCVLMDIHSLQTIGYYDIPVDHIYGEVGLFWTISRRRTSRDDEIVIVSPDVGGVPRARAFAKKLNGSPLAIIDKRRTGHNKAQVMNLIGQVEGKVAILRRHDRHRWYSPRRRRVAPREGCGGSVRVRHARRVFTARHRQVV